jgi:SEC-C motif-containing protein
MTVLTASPCPCGRRGGSRAQPLNFADCCGRWHHAPAPDAESLMRSRYTAFVRGDRDYLLATWHASTRPGSLDLDTSVRWLGLEVRDHCETGPDRAEVEFVARSRPARSGPAHRLHERSRFVREDGRWYYLDGAIS